MIKNKVSLFIIRAIDFFINYLYKNNYKKEIIFKKILLSNGAHLGDVLITSYVIDIIKYKYPNSVIGFCTGSWSKRILENKNIDFIHVIDHFKLNRNNLNIFIKIYVYIYTSLKSIIEIRKIKYDLVIDFYSYFPNNIPIFSLCNIPYRVGYGSGGFGGLLTHENDWHSRDDQIYYYHLELLKNIGINFNPEDAINFAKINRQKKEYSEKYIVIHVGTGSKIREWKVNYWKELVQYLINEKNNIYFTGSGNRELEIVNDIIRNIPGCKNLVNKLSFDEFIDVVNNSQLHIGVESFSGHLAAGLDIHSIIIKSGITSDAHWGPLSSKTYIVRSNVSCAPCHNKNGCKSMDCINNVKPSDVIKIYKELQK